MKGDFTRQTFDRRKHFSEVLFQQGRVQLDADLNEQQDILRDSTRTEARDVIGWAGVPKYGGGFEIAVTGNGEDLTISPGRIYVDGLMCVAEADSLPVESVDTGSVTFGPATKWPRNRLRQGDRFELVTRGGLVLRHRVRKLALAERRIELESELEASDLAKLADPSELSVRLLPSYLHQPDLLEVPDLEDGIHLVYLDVWERLITPLDDPEIREKALGGPDTAARAKIVWQVKLEKTAESAACGEFGPTWKPKEAAADGKLNVRTAPVPATKDPCVLPAQAGFRGLENQLYRVEIHQGGKIGEDAVTFKWSRDNGSVITGIETISGSTLTVSGLGPDEVHGFSDNQWVEIVDDETELSFNSGPLVQIDTTDRTSSTIVLKSTSQTLPTSIDEKLHYKLRRWDSEGVCKAAIPLVNDGWIPLENNLEVKFSPDGVYRTGDYWLIPARTAVGSETGSLEWPQDANGATVAQAPHGIGHHFAPLALVEVLHGKFQATPLSDCRNPFPPLIEVGEGESSGKGAPCCTFTVGDGRRTHGDYDDIEEALSHLPGCGGQLCLLPGFHQANAVIRDKHNITIKGCGLRTLVFPRSSNREDPVFVVAGSSSHIQFSDMCVGSFEGVAIALQGDESGGMREIRIQNCCLLGYRAAIHAQDVVQLAIRENLIRVLDRRGGGVAVYVGARDSVIEGNDIAVTRALGESPHLEIPGPNGPSHFNPQDDCADFEPLYGDPASVRDLTKIIFTRGLELQTDVLVQAGFVARAEGGIQIAAGSERIRIRDNRIRGGAGNGITLGGWSPLDPAAEEEPDESDRPEKTFDHAGGPFYGIVRKEDSVLTGIALSLTSADTKTTYRVVTDQEGVFRVADMPGGQYSVDMMSPDLHLIKIQLEDRTDFVLFAEDAAKTRRQALWKRLAFLREILIEDNRIFQMGLSGIGSSVLTDSIDPATGRALAKKLNLLLGILRLWGNPILDLTIARNHVAGCLNAALSDKLRVLGVRKGVGGISLGICEDVSIIENRIEHNGLAPLPVTAIFVGYGEHLEISLNRIQRNGALPVGFVGETAPGFFRGGIFILLGSCVFDPDAIKNREYPMSIGQYAVRIQGNTVSQPIGRALALGALGPVAVQDNYFDSRGCPPGWLNQVGSAVCIVNLGRSARRPGMVFGKQKNVAGNSTHMEAAANAPSGAVQFSNNQSQVGPFHSGLLPHLIVSLDDVCFEGNQLRSSQGTVFPVLNLLVSGATARVTGNRFQEPQLDRAVSLISRAGLMNTTTHNQGDHCIFALCADSSKLLKDPNQTLATGCNAVAAAAKDLVGNLIKGGKFPNA